MSKDKKGLILDIEDVEKPKLKRGVKTAIFAVVAVAIVVATFSIISFLGGVNKSVDAFGNDENEEIARQKQELTEVYSHMGVDLVDDDFVITRDNHGDVKVALKKNKQDEVESAKNNAFSNLFNDRKNSSDNPPPIGGGGSDNPSDNPDNGDNGGSENGENQDPDPSPEPNKDITESEILDIINETNKNIEEFFDRSLDDSNFYKDALSIMLNSIRTGDPSPNGLYDNHPNYTNEEAFETLCAYVFINCCVNDSDDSIWTNSFFWNYSGNTLYNCLKNENYLLKFSKIDSIYEEEKDFIFNNETITSSYVVYSEGHYVYLTYDLIVLEIV